MDVADERYAADKGRAMTVTYLPPITAAALNSGASLLTEAVESGPPLRLEAAATRPAGTSSGQPSTASLSGATARSSASLPIGVDPSHGFRTITTDEGARRENRCTAPVTTLRRLAKPSRTAVHACHARTPEGVPRLALWLHRRAIAKQPRRVSVFAEPVKSSALPRGRCYAALTRGVHNSTAPDPV